MSQVKPIEEYDSNGRVVYRRDSDGYERWWEYDAKGNVIYHRDSKGCEKRYDSSGNRIDKPTEKKDNSTMSKKTIRVRFTFEYDTGLLADDPKGIVHQKVWDDIQRAAETYHLLMAMRFARQAENEGTDSLARIMLDLSNRKADSIRDGKITDVKILP